MCRSGMLIAFVFVIASTGRVLSDASEAPPSNLASTSEHLATILSSHERALGSRTSSLPDTAIEDWTYTDSGISGTEHLERSGENYHSRITAGQLIEEYGQDNGRRWHRDYNGFVSPTTYIDDRTFFAERVKEDAADPKNDAQVIGITQGADPAYVVQVMVSGERHPEWVYYDARSFLITRVEWFSRDDRGLHRIVTTFSDFRTTAGLTEPWHVHDAWDPSQFDDDYVRTSLQVGVPVDASQFTQPPSASRLPAYQNTGFNIPATIYDDGTIVIRMMVNGRGLDLMLDTANPENVIDENVAEELGLPTYGHVTSLPGGYSVSFYTTIPLATIGTATYRGLVVDAMPFTFQQAEYTKVVGVLGYDFLANNVFEIQYDNGGSVKILPSIEFDSDDPVPGGISYPLDLDAGVPFIAIPIGSGISNDVALANEFEQTVVWGSYVAAHGSDLTNVENGQHYQQSLPFADNGSFGQEVEIWTASISHVSFGSVNFHGSQVIATNYPLSFSQDRPVDAFLGFDFLRWFDVYLDYPHGRLIVKPNQLFLRVTHHG